MSRKQKTIALLLVVAGCSLTMGGCAKPTLHAVCTSHEIHNYSSQTDLQTGVVREQCQLIHPPKTQGQAVPGDNA